MAQNQLPDCVPVTKMNMMKVNSVTFVYLMILSITLTIGIMLVPPTSFIIIVTVLCYIVEALFALVVVVLICHVILLLYSGENVNVEIRSGSPPIGQATIAYKFDVVPFSDDEADTSPFFSQVSKLASEDKYLQIHYFNPQVNARYRVSACILAEGKQQVNKDLLKKFEAQGFGIFKLPEVEKVVSSSFPFITSASVKIAANKIYPKMGAYVEEHGLRVHPFIEIYDGKTIEFMSPLCKQAEFYVPEAKEAFGKLYEWLMSDADESAEHNLSVSLSDDSQTEISVSESSQEQHGDSSQVMESDRLQEAQSETDLQDTQGAESSVYELGQEQEKSDDDSTSSFDILECSETDLFSDTVPKICL